MEQLITNTKAVMAQTRSFMAGTETKVEKQKGLIKNQVASIHNLEIQVGQIVNLLCKDTKIANKQYQRSKYM